MRHTLHSPRAAMMASLAVAVFAGAPVASAAPPATPDAIVGRWDADDGSTKLDFYRAGDAYQAHFLYGNQVVETDGVTMKKDLKNPDPSLRSRSLKNIVIASGLHYANGEWGGGSIYDPSSGRMYRCKAEIKDSKLLLRGYFGMSALGQTRAFHRAP